MEKNKKRFMTQILVRGEDSAKRLQNLLRRKENDDGSVSVDNLVMEILRSFSHGLSVLNSFDSGEFCGVPASLGLASSVGQMPEDYSGKSPAPAVKERRGCYKRRRTVESRVEIRDTIEDGQQWRKYGQKDILNSKFPRCYFRCTHKPVHGCKAQRQVQQLDDESNMFHITYLGHHTCPVSHTLSHPGRVLDFKDSENFRCFPNTPSTISNVHIDPSIKHEDESKAQSIDVSDDISSANDNHSTHLLLMNDLGHDDVHGHHAPSFMGFDREDSSASTGSYGYLDMDYLSDVFLNDVLPEETYSEVNLMDGAFLRFG